MDIPQWKQPSPLLWVVLAVLCLGVTTRFIGIDHGEERWIFHLDVAKQARVARAYFMGDLNVFELWHDDYEMSAYPYGASILAGQVMRWLKPGHENRDKLGRLPIWHWAMVMRYFAIGCFLAAAVGLVVVLARAWSLPAALAAGLLLVLEPVHNQHNHYGMNDIPMIACILGAWMSLLGMLGEGRKRWVGSACCGLLLGFATGIKYQALIAGLLPATVWLALLCGKRFKELLISVGVFAIVFLPAAAYTLHPLTNQPEEFIKVFPLFMEWQASIVGLDEPQLVTFARNVKWTLRFFWQSGWWLMVPGAAWAVWAGLRTLSSDRTFALAVLAAALFAGVMLVIFLVSREMMRDNDLMPIATFLAVLNGACVFEVTRRSRTAGRWVTAALVGASLFYGVNAYADSFAFTRRDTRVKARYFAQEHFDPKTRAVFEMYVLPIQRKDILEIRCRFVGNSERAAKVFDRNKHHYVLVSDRSYARFFDPLNPYYDEETQKRYRWIEETMVKMAEFSDRRLPFTHPTITVYKRPEPEAP